MLTKIWTTAIVLSAAASLVAWVCVAAHARGIRPFRAIARFTQKLSLAGVVVFGLMAAPLYRAGSTKVGGGTNNVPPNLNQPLPQMQQRDILSQTGFTGLTGFVGEGNPVNPGQDPITSTNTTRMLTAEDFERGFVMARVGTSEGVDFSAPSNAVVCVDWLEDGAAVDWVYVAMTNWMFKVGTNNVECLRVYSFGKIVPFVPETNGSIATNNWFAPFMASLGVVPEANWELLDETDRPSQVWYCITPDNALVVTWRNALLDRDTGKPLSFQAEFRTNGQFTYRYDLSRLDAETVTNILAGVSFAGNEWTTNALPTNVTSMAFCPLLPGDAYDEDSDGDGVATIDELFVHYTDPHNADTDYDGLADYDELFVYDSDPLDPNSVSEAYCDGLAVRMGLLDLFSCPEGSTNTVLEHVFYSGTTNGAFAYPQPSVETAVLKVMVSGCGTGRLVVGDDVVPLVGFSTGLTGLRGGANPDNPANPVTNTLLLAVGRGVRKEVWFDKPDDLDVALDSDDFLIGEMPTWYWAHGWLAFPHTDATVPCIHDLYAKARTVTLVHGEEFAGLAATWKSDEQGVAIMNVPPVSAEVYGSFPKNQTRTICYTMSHPDYMGGQTNYVQTLEFCPKLTESEDLDDPPDEEEEPYYICDCGTGGTCSCCTGEWCHCTCWDCPCNQNQSPALGDNDEEAEEAYTNIVSGALQPLGNTLYLYMANTKTVHLDVPSGNPVECCPCPDHRQSNYVAKAFCSRRLSVSCADGAEEFRISYNPCDVTVSGVSPSRAFSDAFLLFVTNGATYKVRDYTVLGVKFESMYGRASLSNCNHRSASLGYPVAICTNINNAGSIVMRTDVLLPDGFVRLSMEEASGDVALWLPEWWDSHGAWHPAERLLNAGGVTMRYMTIRRWRNIMRRYNIQNAVEARIVSSRPSSCRLRLDFIASNGEGYVHDFAAQRISAVKPPLLPDYNRDMMADIKDVIDMGNQRLLYFWANRDIWQGDDAFDRYSHFYLTEPDFPGNCEDMVVNGRNDLVNLCPFAVDLSTFVRKWGTAGVRYEFYSGRPDEVHFVPVGIGWRALDKMVMEDGQTVFGDDLHSATLLKNSVGQSGEVGYALPQQLLSLGESESGCLALEFASTGLITPRIRICDEESGETLFETAVAVRVLDVHRMYRWLNLEYACDVTLDAKYNDRLTVDWPDNEHSDANVVFVHGYNMHPSETWEWSQAMFKRLWWSGMDAGFTAVEWHGNHSQLWIPKIPLVTDGSCYGTLNYHQNVLNAFRTASTFASRVNGLPGARKYMVAHSLGNMLVSAARQDYGLQYDKYFMLNAAVAVEAYDPVGGVTEDSRRDMTPLAWRPYSNRVRPTHWYELFLSNPNDERRNLTWKGRFRDVDNTINFYSSKDEVVANGDEDVKELVSRKFAWYNQEQKKGVFLVSASPQAGWKFSDHYIVQRDTGRWENGAPVCDYRKYTPEETSAIADTNLMVRPFFRDFMDTQIYGEGGSEFLLANENVRWYALSHGIPAESFAAGANPVPNWSTEGRNVDMAKECNPKAVSPGGAQVELDTKDDDEGMVNWIHSYFIGKSLFDTKLLYEKLVGHIGSTKPKERVDNE